MSTLSSIPASEFYFVAQHIIKTLAESYAEDDDRFGPVTLDDVHMGPGSRMAIALLDLPWNRPKKTTKMPDEPGLDEQESNKEDPYFPMSNYLHLKEANRLMAYIKQLNAKQLRCLGLYRDSAGQIRVILTGRLVTYLILEHIKCKVYLFFNRKSASGMIAENPILDVPQCPPVRYNVDDLDPILLQGALSKSMQVIVTEALEAFKNLDFHMPWKARLKSEYPDSLGWDEICNDPDREYFARESPSREVMDDNVDVSVGLAMPMDIENECDLERLAGSVSNYYWSTEEEEEEQN